MQNLQLRDYLFNSLRGNDTRYGIILMDHYNSDVCKYSDKLVLMAHKELLSGIIDCEGIRRDDVIHNAGN